MQEIAIIGPGAMGSRMAMRLVEAGYTVRVHGRRRAAAAALEEAGAAWAETPREAAARAEIVIAMVTDDEASRAVWQSATGALAGLRPGAVAIESSTLSAPWVRRLASLVAARGAGFLEAPVIGSRPQAQAGQLVYLVGGEPQTLGRVQPVLATMGAAIHPTGAIGSATAVKLAVNALFATQVAAWAEVLGALGKAGIEPSAAVELLGSTPVASPVMRGVAPTIVARRFEPLFPIDLVHKDLRYFVEAATEAGAEVPTTAAVRDAYARAQRAGHGEDNITGIAKVVG